MNLRVKHQSAQATSSVFSPRITLPLLILGALLAATGSIFASSAAAPAPEDGVEAAPSNESSAQQPPRPQVPARKAPPASAKEPPHPPKAPAPKAAPKTAPRRLPKHFPVWGVRDAAVRIVLFSDFECPYCARTAKAITQVMKRYPKDVQIEYLNLPLPQHASARPAALAALAAHRQGAFWPMHDQLFDGDNDLDHASFLKMAEALSLDVGRFERDLKDPALNKEIDREIAIGKALGVDGTPTLFINGHRISGAKPFRLLQVHIDAEIAAAAKVQDRGRAWLLKRSRRRNRDLVALVY